MSLPLNDRHTLIYNSPCVSNEQSFSYSSSRPFTLLSVMTFGKSLSYSTILRAVMIKRFITRTTGVVFKKRCPSNRFERLWFMWCSLEAVFSSVEMCKN